jgi:uncharacterized protein YndB with AHSA1/START domain
MSEYGIVTAPDTVRLERVLPGPIERVWAYLTEPDKRAKWLAGGSMELKVGGAVELRFKHADLSAEKAVPERYREKMEKGHSMRGRVTRCEPPRVLAYTWGDDGSEVMFELSPSGDGTRLVLTHRGLDRKGMLSVSGGWHTHLGILDDVLNGREPRGFWSTHAKLAAEYERRFAEPGP